MVKLTIIGRVSDGMPLVQCPRYANTEEKNDFLAYKQQGEFLLEEISKGALPTSKMTIPIDHHHSFNYMIENGVCFITLCDSSYPTKLVVHYLQDLHKEFDKFNTSEIRNLIKPYSFPIFDNVISSIRLQYVDTRTQANLSKLNANDRELSDLDIHTEQLSQIIKRRRRSDMLERAMEAPRHVSPIWGSKTLEIIALKWTPITIIVVVASVLIFTVVILKDELPLFSSSLW